MDTTQQAETSSDQVEISVASELKTSKYVEYVKKLINSQMLITTGDGRSYCGTFHCMDKQGNIILKEAVEYQRPTEAASSPKDLKPVPLVLFPVTWQKSCKVDCPIEEQLSTLSLQD